MPERFVTLMYFERYEQAEYQRERLENAGIRAEVVEEWIGEPDEFTEDVDEPLTSNLIKLQVPESEAERAGQILEEETDNDMGSNPSIK